MISKGNACYSYTNFSSCFEIIFLLVAFIEQPLLCLSSFSIYRIAPAASSKRGAPIQYLQYLQYLPLFGVISKSRMIQGVTGVFGGFLSAQRLPPIRPKIAPYPPKDCPLSVQRLPPYILISTPVFFLPCVSSE